MVNGAELVTIEAPDGTRKKLRLSCLASYAYTSLELSQLHFLRGEAGPQGEQGPRGERGARGERGLQGVRGPAGERGVQGDVGPVGPQGSQGETGPQGAASTVPGPQGEVGPQGPPGETGAQGPASTVPGPQGPQGEAGPSGDQGAQGVQGEQGPQGPAGGQFNWSVTSANTNIAHGQAVGVDTTAGEVTLTLPASPDQGDTVKILDTHGQFATNKVTVARNGATIMQLAEDLDITTNFMCIELVYLGTNWSIV